MMGFRHTNLARLAKFNSANSCEFLDMYDTFVNAKILEKAAKPSSKTFAPSSIRCKRRSWFRLRGVEPDVPKVADATLNFTADIGTACHEIIQTNLRECLGDGWVSVEEYLTKFPIPYEYKLTSSGLETQVELVSPPMRFACDGILHWKGRYWLLEIKTSDYSSFDELTGPKPQHVDQIQCYATLLHLHDVLVLYQDRQYGGLKCYQLTVSDDVMDQVKQDLLYVMDMVEANLAPERLPQGDAWCSPSQCRYFKKCKEWG